jgi:hypothetical protein
MADEVAASGAKARYGKLMASRETVLERVRECSDLTIPGLIPRAGMSDEFVLPTPYQSLGARGVNNLASKLLLALLPPNTAYFRLSMDEDVAMKLAGDSPGAKEQIDTALAKLERKISRRIETSNARPILFETLKLLVVSGNALLYADKERNRVFRLDQYVICRDPVGHPLEAIICEKVLPQALDESIRTLCDLQVDSEVPVELYTRIVWKDKKVSYHQELNDVKLPGTDGEHPFDKTPWCPLRWQPFANSDYGRGLVDEYLGDLRSLEGISTAIVQFAAAAAKVLFLVHPNATTDATDLVQAESGDVINGSAADVDILQLEKAADFQVANEVADKLEKRLSNAFLLQGGAVRDAERVTAEEIRGMAQELEDVLGGVYTVLSRELQLPMTERIMAQMTRDKELPALPKGAVQPLITTGFEALGRNHAANKLRAFLADAAQALTPQVVAQYIKAGVVLNAFGKNYGVENLDDMIRTDDEVQQMQQAAMKQQAMMKAAPGVAQEVTKGAVAAHLQGGTQPQQPPQQ